MKKFNVNNSIYIQITKTGFEHLDKTLSADYIKNCIIPYWKEINGEIWYQLQIHEVFELLPVVFSGEFFWKTEMMFEDDVLEDVKVEENVESEETPEFKKDRWYFVTNGEGFVVVAFGLRVYDLKHGDIHKKLLTCKKLITTKNPKLHLMEEAGIMEFKKATYRLATLEDFVIFGYKFNKSKSRLVKKDKIKEDEK